MNHIDLMIFYKISYFLASSNVLSVTEVENCIPWEREIYFNQHKSKLEEEKSKNA
jgi:hypothetical protein